MKIRSKKKIKSKSKLKKRLIRTLNICLIIIFGGIFYSLGVTVYENVQVNADIEAFKARAIQEISEEIEYIPGVYQQRVYHIVPRETSYELSDTRSVFYSSEHKYLGQTGDIFLAPQSPFPQNPVFDKFMTYYFGGHTAFKSDHNTFYEATGYSDSFSEIIEAIKAPGNEPTDLTITANETSTNYWLYPKFRTEASEEYPYYGTYYRNYFVGARVKNITNTQLEKVTAFGDAANDKYIYNYLFFLNMKYKYYCSDFVSRAYQSAIVAEDEQRQYSTVLNDDGFITSVNDIILSDDTYITFYVEIIDDVVHIYHLEDI
ncbi:MAG: hypothetical protein WCR19_06175 [Acholeplasmataceae bacterium]